MDSRQKLIEDIFSAALDEPDVPTRQAYLDQACAGDASLRTRVDQLLHAHTAAADFLEAVEHDPDETVDVPTPPLGEAAGDRVGHYRLIERIGKGGFGVVYLAEQDEPVRRQVALKIIKLGMDTEQVIARFEAERQALAVMDHPHIAKVYDAGATETGRPYFVMELVKGVPITKYSDDNRLTVEQRLELFLEVCGAVQHAHTKGIIHRDIKPSNVIVSLQDRVAVPKIIDFGIAKATSQRLTNKSYYTGFREFIGTPEYMSPEQASMGAVDVDTRADTYSLGVLLYELLTGSTPFGTQAPRDGGRDEVERLIWEEEVVKPSSWLGGRAEDLSTLAYRRRTDPAHLVKCVRGDLDWICIKALERDRARRYQTASELAADVQRHLEHQPVLAGRPGYVYRLAKFVRRNRVAVLACAVVSVAMVVSLALAIMGSVQANRARDELRVERDAARVMKVAADTSAAQARQEATKAAAVNEFLQGMLASVDPSQALGREVSVGYVLDQAAHRLNDGALNGQPQVEAAVRMTLGSTCQALGRYEDAEFHLRTAAAIRIRERGEEHPEALRAQSAVVALLNDRSKHAEAEVLARRTAELQQRVLGPEHPDTLVTISRLGVALSNQNKLSEAEVLHRQIIQTQRRVLGDEHVDTLRSIVRLGTVLLGQGKPQEAEAMLREALDTQERVLGAQHPEGVQTMNILALAVERQGNGDEAARLYRRSYEFNRQVLGADHPRTQITMNNLLRVLQHQGRVDEQRPLVAERLARLRRLAQQPGADALALNAYAWDLVTCTPEDLRDPEAALPFARRAVEVSGGTDANILDTLASVYHLTGALDEAIATQRLAVGRARAGGPYNVAELEKRLSDLLLERGDLLGALGVNWEDLAGQIGRSLADDAMLGGSLAMRGQALLNDGNYVEAEQNLRACLVSRQKGLPAGHWLVCETLILLGDALARQTRFAEAEPLMLEGYRGVKDSPQVSGERKREALLRLIQLYDNWGHAEQARQWRERLPAPPEAGK